MTATVARTLCLRAMISMDQMPFSSQMILMNLRSFAFNFHLATILRNVKRDIWMWYTTPISILDVKIRSESCKETRFNLPLEKTFVTHFQGSCIWTKYIANSQTVTILTLKKPFWQRIQLLIKSLRTLRSNLMKTKHRHWFLLYTRLG